MKRNHICLKAQLDTQSQVSAKEHETEQAQQKSYVSFD